MRGVPKDEGRGTKGEIVHRPSEPIRLRFRVCPEWP